MTLNTFMIINFGDNEPACNSVHVIVWFKKKRTNEKPNKNKEDPGEKMPSSFKSTSTKASPMS